MKILIDLTSLADNFSGIERYAASLSLEMIQEETIEFILVFKEKIHGMFQEYQGKSNVRMIILPRFNKLFFNQIILPFKIYQIKADWYLFLAFPVPVLLFKKNMVSTIHDICCWDCPETMNGLSKWYFRISHRIAILKCKAIITISKFSEDRIVEKLGYPRNKIWRIYCGLDKKFLEYMPDAATEKYAREKYNLPVSFILSLSTLEPRKNIRLLIDAYSDLVTNNKIKLPLVLAGRKGWKMDKLLDGINPRVKSMILFTGFIDDEDLPSVYASAELFVFPSMYEGFGIPPLEALACGTKVATSRIPSLVEVLGSSSSYFNYYDKEEAMKAIMNTLIKSVDTSANMTDYRWCNYSKNLIRYLEDVVCNQEK